MRHARPILLVVASLASGAALAQAILFFESPDFKGRRFGASHSISNLASEGFKVEVRAPLDLRLASSVFGPAAAALVPRDLRRLAGLPERPRRELPVRALNSLAWRVAPLLEHVPVLNDVLDAWAMKLVGETPVKLALHRRRR